MTVALRPDSRWFRFRRRLAKRIEPKPSPGEAWCVSCSHNDGRTLILPAAVGVQHAESHEDDSPGGFIMLQIGPQPASKEDNDHGR